MSAFLTFLLFLLNNTSSNMRGIELLPTPLVPTNCVNVDFDKSISFLSPYEKQLLHTKVFRIIIKYSHYTICFLYF